MAKLAHSRYTRWWKNDEKNCLCVIKKINSEREREKETKSQAINVE